MSVLAMAMVKEALTIHPEEEGRAIRDANLLFNTISSLGWSKQQFYDMFIQSLEQYIIFTVLPSLRQKHGQFMLGELLERWSKHKDIDWWLRSLIDCLHQRHLENWQPPIPLEQVGFTCFREMIYSRIKGQVKDATLALIRKERANEQIDRVLLKNVVVILVELGSGRMDCYENDFEYSFLEETTDHYSEKAKNWILEDSYPAYMHKAEECFRQERERVGHYLQISSEPKLLERLQNVLGQYRMQLLEKEKFKCSAFIRDDKVQDLSNMYRVFSESMHVTEMITMYKTHLNNVIADLVKQAEDSAINTKVFLRKMVELHEKFIAQVKKCFQDDMRFRKVFHSALEYVYSKGVSGSSGAEFFAFIFENILRKGNIEKIRDGSLSEKLRCEAIEYAFKEAARSLIDIANLQFKRENLANLYRKEFARAFISFDLQQVLLPSLRKNHGENLLSKLVEPWLNHKAMVLSLLNFLHPLDQYMSEYMNIIAVHVPLDEVWLSFFHESIYQKIKGQVKFAVIDQIDKERGGQIIDRNLLKNVLDIFLNIDPDVDCYGNDFEVSFLEGTAEYYSVKAKGWIDEYSCRDYMIKVEECLKQEQERVGPYLHVTSEHMLLEVMQKVLITKHLDALFHDDNVNMMENMTSFQKLDHLSRMYSLLCKIKGGLEPLAEMFKTLLINEDPSLVNLSKYSVSNKEPKKDMVKLQVFVRKIIELHEKYVDLVQECFQNRARFRQIIIDVFEVFCGKNVFASSSAELLATFCDNILKKGGEKLSNEAIEEGIDKVVRMLAYISDKDLFAAFYRKKLARRLLFDKNANAEHERMILKKLEQQFGGHFTSKMKGMVNDLTVSRDEQTKFEQFIAANPKLNPGIDLSVIVLRRGFCPSYKTFDMNLPPEMVKYVEVFQEFYQTRTENRKLTWIYSLGSCNIDATFDSKSIQIIVTTCQAAILFLFNVSNRLSYSEIITRLNLPDNVAVCSLYYLSCAKYKILNKEPANETISPKDVFVFNSKFTCRMQRIKIPLPPTDEKKEVLKDVHKDRKHAIQGSIVRIMKFRKVMVHAELVAECVKQLRPNMFEPDSKAIKKQIQSLIDRGYMERDKDKVNTYIYLP